MGPGFLHECLCVQERKVGQAGVGPSAEGVHVGVCYPWKGGTWLWPGRGGGAASRGCDGTDAVARRYLGHRWPCRCVRVL